MASETVASWTVRSNVAWAAFVPPELRSDAIPAHVSRLALAFERDPPDERVSPAAFQPGRCCESGQPFASERSRWHESDRAATFERNLRDAGVASDLCKSSGSPRRRACELHSNVEGGTLASPRLHPNATEATLAFLNP